jgi:ABC-type uncharacterized transport system substrate-binding protein
MKSKLLFWLLITVLLITSSAQAQQAGKVSRIGFLDNSTASGIAVLLDAFQQELTKLGWVQGKNIAIEYRFAEQKLERLPELAADLVRLKVDLIVGTTTPAALAAKKATTTIPIVMASVTDPVGAGLVASLARPGGNITGTSGLADELNTKRLEILKDAVPNLARVGILRLAGGSDRQLKDLRQAKIGRDRDSTSRQSFIECLSNRRAETGEGDYDDRQSPLFRRKKADRRARQQASIAGDLFPEGVC